MHRIRHRILVGYGPLLQYITWCNLFQVTRNETTGEAIYINYSFGGQGAFAPSTGNCPINLSRDADLKPLQATFSSKATGGSNSMMTCNVPSYKTDDQQLSCNSQFEKGEVPIHFKATSGKKTLPVIDVF